MSLSWSVTGSGPTVVLLHGVCHRRHAWDAIVPGLAGDFRVVTVDLPGHGESPDVADASKPSRLADEVADFLHEAVPEGERAHLVGNSLGGYVALELGARGEAESVTALSPAGFFTGPRDQVRAVGTFRVLRAIARRFEWAVPTLARSRVGRTVFMGVFCAKPWRYPESNMVIDSGAIVTNTMVDRGLRAEFEFSEPVDADLPISVAWGAYDLVLPRYEAAGVGRSFPNAELTFPKVGHVPMTDDPAGVVAVIRRTVARARRRGPDTSVQ